jgi:hypothetical protein
VVAVRELGEAALLGNYAGLPVAGRGRLQLVDLPRPDRGYIALLDGAVKLRL